MEGGWGAGPYSRGVWGSAWWEPGIEESVTASDVLAGQQVFNNVVAESVTPDDVVAGQQVFNAGVIESVNASDGQQGGIVFSQVYAEQIVLSSTFSAQVSFSCSVSAVLSLTDLYATWGNIGPSGGQSWTPEASTGSQVWSNIIPGTTPDWH